MIKHNEFINMVEITSSLIIVLSIISIISMKFYNMRFFITSDYAIWLLIVFLPVNLFCCLYKDNQY